jgi:predicted fused transcriptional regulator/phosphomethylpyrimidine kinase
MWYNTIPYTSVHKTLWFQLNCAEAVPKRCRSGAEAVPKRCRSGAEAVPKQCRSSAEEVVGFPGRLTKNSNIANNALYLSCGK